jgi:hypothetical protein
MRRSRFAAYVTTLLLAAGAALTGATSAQAATGPYVALGDSYSSGVGAGSYISSSGDCKQSTKAYPYLWAAAKSPSSFSFRPARALERVMFWRTSWAPSAQAPRSSPSASAATTPASPTS